MGFGLNELYNTELELVLYTKKTIMRPQQRTVQGGNLPLPPP